MENRTAVTLEAWFRHHKFSGVYLAEEACGKGIFVKLSVPEKPGVTTVYFVGGNTMIGVDDDEAHWDAIVKAASEPVRFAPQTETR